MLLAQFEGPVFIKRRSKGTTKRLNWNWDNVNLYLKKGNDKILRRNTLHLNKTVVVIISIDRNTARNDTKET